MLSLENGFVKKFNYYRARFIKFVKLLIILKNRVKTNIRLYPLDPYNDLRCKRIFRKNKLEIILDNPHSPEEGRELLNIFFSIKNNFSSIKNNLIIARNSSIRGYLDPIINFLTLKPVSIKKDFNSFLLSLTKTPVIYSFDPCFSSFLFRDISYLAKLRTLCRDELVIAIKTYTDKKVQSNTVEDFISKNYDNAFSIEKDEIYYVDGYIRWLLHDSGFFEVLGPLFSFPGNYTLRTRLIADEGRYTVVDGKENQLMFKGIAVYRASTKTFVNYLENL